MSSLLRTSYVMKQQKIQGKEILFVHSRPPKDINLVKNLKESNDGGIRDTQLTYDELDFVVWNREDDTVTHIGQDGRVFDANCTGKIKI